MKQNKAKTLIGVAALALSLVPFTFAQSQSQQPQPVDPTAQQPASPPQSTPPTFPQSTKPDAQQPDPSQQPDSQTSPNAQQPSDSTAASTAGRQRTFMGTVLKTGDGYILRAGDSQYKLDDQDRAKQFECKDVKVMGKLDPQSNTIHVQSIATEPAM